MWPMQCTIQCVRRHASCIRFYFYCIFFFIGGGAFEFKVQMEIIFIRFNVTGLQEIRSNMLPNGHNASGVMS